MAVRLLPALLEAALVELFEAVGADEVLRVELPHHGGDDATRDAPVARGTDGLGATRGRRNLCKRGERKIEVKDVRGRGTKNKWRKVKIKIAGGNAFFMSLAAKSTTFSLCNY